MDEVTVFNTHCCGEIGDVVTGIKNLNFKSPKEASSKLFKAKKFESSNSSGAGDALFSGFLYAICKGKTSFEAAEFGISLAEKTLEISGPVNPEVSELGKTLR